MDRFQLDFGFLNEVVNPDTSRVPYRGNEDKFVRVAFDLFKTKDNSCEDLWKIQADDDGNEYLVRTYDVEDVVVEADWSVALDKTAANLTVSYKGMPIHRLVASDYNAQNEADALLLRDVVQEKLATSKEFLVKFAGELPAEKREVLAEMGAIDPADLAFGLGTEDDEEEPDHGPGFKRDPSPYDFVAVLKDIGLIAQRGLESEDVETLKEELRSIKGHVDRMFHSQSPTLKYQGE